MITDRTYAISRTSIFFIPNITQRIPRRTVVVLLRPHVSQRHGNSGNCGNRGRLTLSGCRDTMI
jgi:hypothetical protein